MKYEVSRKWIMIPTAAFLVWLVAGTAALLSGAAWGKAAYIVLLILCSACMFFCGSRLRCPACGAPLYALNGRYLFQEERDTYCAKCGAHIRAGK